MRDLNAVKRGNLINLENLRKTIDEGPYDAVMVTTPENVPYYSGFYNEDMRSLPERIHYVIWKRGEDPVFLVVNKRKNTLLPDDTFITKVIGYDGEGVESAPAVAETLIDLGLQSGTIGFEAGFLPGGVLRGIEKLVPDVNFVAADSFLEKPRLIKTPAEIEKLVEAAAWTTRAIDTAFGAARPGDTEKSVSVRMQWENLKNGADQIVIPVFGAGERSGQFHAQATDKPIEEGMLFNTDFVAMIDGYYSDLARTAVMGKASDYQRDMYAKLVEIKNTIVHSIKPGMLASEVAQIGRQAYADRNLEYKWSILGHSIGMGLHESPQIYPWVHEPILPNMVMMIEVGYHQMPEESFHIEDMIVITDSGAEYRSDFSKHETLWEIGV